MYTCCMLYVLIRDRMQILVSSGKIIIKISWCPSPPTSYCILLCYKNVTVPSASGHFELFEETTKAVDFLEKTASRLCAQTYSVKLFISLPTGIVCQQRLAMQKKKGSGEVVYRNDGAEAEEAWSGIGQHRSLCGTFSIICHTDTRIHTPVHSHGVQISLPSSVKLLSMEGQKKMLHSVHSVAKIKLSQEVACVVLPSTRH